MPRQDRVNTQPVGGAFINTPYTVFTPNYSPSGTTPLRPIPLPTGINQRDVNQALEAMAINNTYTDNGARPGGAGALLRAETVASQLPTRGDVVGGYKHIDTMDIPLSQSEAADNAVALAEQDLVNSLQNPMASPVAPGVAPPAPRSGARTSGPRRTPTGHTQEQVDSIMRNHTQDVITGGFGSMAGVGAKDRGTSSVGRGSDSYLQSFSNSGMGQTNNAGADTVSHIYEGEEDGHGQRHARKFKHRNVNPGYSSTREAMGTKWRSKDGKHAIVKVDPKLLPHLQEYFGDTGMIADYDGDGIPNEIDPTPNG